MLLRRLIGLLIVMGLIAGVGKVFWNAMHPMVPGAQGTTTYQGPPSPYSTEGGHDPNRAFHNTQDELNFRGANLQTKKFE